MDNKAVSRTSEIDMAQGLSICKEWGRDMQQLIESWIVIAQQRGRGGDARIVKKVEPLSAGYICWSY